MSIFNKIVEQVLIVVITGSPAFQVSCRVECSLSPLPVKMQIANMLFNNTFLCIWGDIVGVMGKFFKTSIFNIFIGQKREMTELKLVWPVNTTGHRLKIILSPVSWITNDCPEGVLFNESCLCLFIYRNQVEMKTNKMLGMRKALFWNFFH